MISDVDFKTIAPGDLLVFANNPHSFIVDDIEIGDPRNPHGAIKLNLTNTDTDEKTFAYRHDMDIADFVYEDGDEQPKGKPDEKSKPVAPVRKSKPKPKVKPEGK